MLVMAHMGQLLKSGAPPPSEPLLIKVRYSSPQRVPGPRVGGNPIYDKISSIEVERTSIIGGGLIVAPPSANTKPTVTVEGEGGGGEEGRGGGGGGGRVAELERRLLKVTREKERLKQANAVLQKNLVEVQKQVRTITTTLNNSKEDNTSILV